MLKTTFNEFKSAIKSYYKAKDSLYDQFIHLPVLKSVKPVVKVGDADATILDDDSGSVINVSEAITTAEKTYTLPAAAVGLNYTFLFTVASDSLGVKIVVPSGLLLGAVLAQNGSGTTIVQSDASDDTFLRINDNIEPGTLLTFQCVDGTNWFVSGTVLSSDANPAFG